MNKFKILFMIAVTSLITGCGLTEAIKEWANEKSDTNNYELKRDIQKNMCNPIILDLLSRDKSKAWKQEVIDDCKKAEEKTLSN